VTVQGYCPVKISAFFRHLLQQLTPERLIPKAPPSLNPFESPGQLFPPPAT
jgi:hypothetical protein